MLTRNQILQRITENQHEIDEFGVEKIGLFGSYSRNEQTEQSDIDILVAFRPEEETFDNLMNLHFFLDALFPGKKVELVTINGLSPFIGPKILQEVSYAEVAA